MLTTTRTIDLHQFARGYAPFIQESGYCVAVGATLYGFSSMSDFQYGIMLYVYGLWFMVSTFGLGWKDHMTDSSSI